MASDELHDDTSANQSRNGREPDPVTEHVITSADAGWLTPSLFVARGTLVCYDPPRRRRRIEDTDAG